MARKIDVRHLRARDVTVQLHGRTYAVNRDRLTDWWEAVGIVRVELHRNDLDGQEWWEAHKFVAGRWQCAGEGPSVAVAISRMRSWRRAQRRQ